MKKSLSLIMALMLVVLSLFTFNIKTNIKAQELTDEQIIDIELNNIFVPSETIFDFPLVTDSAYNSDITWTSNNEAVIKIENGWAVVNRPTDSDKEVTLTVTITRGNTNKDKEFKVTVLKGVTETNSYKINYTLNGGVNNVNNPTTYKVGETPKLLTPTNGTVEFLGWYLNGELITELPHGLSGDITVVARWGSATMTSIEVITKPTKLEYNAFEKFDASGLVIRAYFNDSEHSYTDIDYSNVEITYDKNILHGDDTKVVITYHGLKAEVEIKVNKIDYDFSNVKFEKIVATYDGLEHTALISGELPEGVTVKYSNNKLTNVGELTAVATFEYDEVNYNKPADLTTTIKINKATLTAKVQDVQVKPGVTPVYQVIFSGFVNGENESVLDDEVVFLDNLNNDYSKPGTYPVGLKEIFDNNYEIIRVGGTLTITEGEYVIDVLEETLEKVYTGENQLFEVVVKQGEQTVTGKELVFKLADGSEFKGATTVGKYKVTVSLKDGEAESVTVDFEITKATYDLSKVEFKDITVTFDGQAHELVYKNVPTGLEVVVDGETKLTNAGEVEATISFVNKDSNYNDVTTTLTATLTINKATLTKDLFEVLPEVGFTGEAHEPKVNGKLGEYVLTEKDYDITYDRNTDIGTAYVILNGKENFEGEVQLTFTITESDLSRVRTAKEELENTITELPETFVLEATNKSQVTWLSTSTALMINNDGTYNTILVENANEVVVYALVQYNNAVDYAKFTFVLPVKDTDTNIEIENVESNITVKAGKLADTTLANYTVEGEEVVFGYDISLVKDNTSVQPNSKVTVKIPIPEEYLGNETLKVYHVTETGTVDMNAAVVDGYLVFETDSFSHYFVTIEEVEEENLEKTVEELLELEVSDSFYQVTGVVRNIYNTTYGNFYLYNLEESVYITVYGLTKEQVSSNDKSFATIGLKEGDIVTLMGTRSDYNGTAQIGGPAYYVSHTSPEYEVTLEVEGEGQAELSANKVVNGNTVTLTVSANDGYKLSSIKVNNVSQSLGIDQEKYEITIYSKTTIRVTFVEDIPLVGEVVKLATFEFGTNGEASHYDGKEAATYTEENNGYIFSYSGASKVYTEARDLIGNSVLKLGTGSVVGTFTFTVDSNITKVVIKVAKYKANNTTVKINGAEYVIETSSNDGNYTDIEIDTTSTKTIVFETISGKPRCMINTIEYYGIGSLTDTPKEPETPTEYILILNTDGGTLDKTTYTFTDYKTISLPTPTKTNYNFLGWYDGDTKVEALTENKNLTLTAKWEEIPSGGEEDPEEPSETDVLATFEFGANGDATHKDGSDAPTYNEENNGYTFSFSDGTKVYSGAFDQTGKSALKLGTSKLIGSFSFTVDETVKKVVIKVAQYKANATVVSVNGTEYTIETSSDAGSYTEITIDTTTNKTITFATVATTYRCMIDSISYYGGESSSN